MENIDDAINGIDAAVERELMAMFDDAYREDPEWAPSEEEIESMQRDYCEDLECTQDNLFDAMCNITRSYSEKLTRKEI